MVSKQTNLPVGEEGEWALHDHSHPLENHGSLGYNLSPVTALSTVSYNKGTCYLSVSDHQGNFHAVCLYSISEPRCWWFVGRCNKSLPKSEKKKHICPQYNTLNITPTITPIQHKSRFTSSYCHTWFFGISKCGSSLEEILLTMYSGTSPFGSATSFWLVRLPAVKCKVNNNINFVTSAWNYQEVLDGLINGRTCIWQVLKYRHGSCPVRCFLLHL